jgi:protease I
MIVGRCRALALVLLVLLGLAGLAHAQAAGKKVVMLIAQDGFEDTEYSKTREALDNAGAEVVVAAQEAGTAKGQSGKRVDCALSYAQVVPSEYDAVVFIGGKGSRKLVDHPEAQRVAREAMDSGMLVGAICYSPVVLAKAGVIEGRTVTSADAWGSKRDMAAAGCTWKGSTKVLRDGNLITGNGPKASKEFGKAVAEALAE